MNACSYEIYREGVIWRFALRAANGKILFTSANRYATQAGARGGITVISALIKQEPRVTLR